jgi:hypothetical protein
MDIVREYNRDVLRQFNIKKRYNQEYYILQKMQVRQRQSHLLVTMSIKNLICQSYRHENLGRR